MSNETRSLPSGMVSGERFRVLALPAIAVWLTSASKIYIGIFLIVGVAFWTMGNCCVPFGHPSQFVILNGCHPKMVRVNATGINALVMNNQTIRNVANEKVVGHSVCPDALGNSKQPHHISKPAVSFVGFAASPVPAVRSGNGSNCTGRFGQLEMGDELGQCIRRLAPVSSSSCCFHVCGKKQTDSPSVNRVRMEPHLKSRFENVLAYVSSRFKAAQTVSNLS